MKQLVRGAIAILALSGLSACVDDPLAPLNGDPDRIQANPNVMWVKQGDSSAVLLRLINANNAATPTKFDISAVGAGILVNLDPKYRPEYTAADTLYVPEIKSQQRYYIRGVTPGEYNYTVSSSGVTGTFKVRVEAINLGAAMSPTAGAAGATVTITAPATTLFTVGTGVGNTNGSQVTFASGAAPTTEVVSPDGRTLTFTLSSGQSGVATVTLVKTVFPGLTSTVTQTLSTTNSMTLVP